MEYEIRKISEMKEYQEDAAKWFHEKWGIPIEAYRESMEESFHMEQAVPEWYIVLDEGNIIGGMGVIENDFHARKDLTPNVCAVYVEEDYRCKGIAGELLAYVCNDMSNRGIHTLYLVTGHIGFYERYGWKYECPVLCDGESKTSRMYVHKMKETRPHVSIQTPGCLEQLMQSLDEHMELFRSFDQVAGIMLDGGMSRGYADELSEVDVVIYVHEQAYRNYKEKQTPCALGITKIDGQLYDIKLLNYEEELDRAYEAVALWDLSYAKIIYDPDGKIQRLFSEKLKQKTNVDTAGGFMFEAWWSYRLAGDIWIRREDVLQGHYCLNNAITPLISALFIANEEFVPHEKWLIHMSRTLAWKPDRYEEQLKQVLQTGDMSLESLKTRQAAIDCLWKEIDQKLCEENDFHAGLNMMQKDGYEALWKILDKGSVSIEEWKSFSRIEDLNYEPLFSICRLVNGNVVVDYEKMHSLGEADLYEYFLEIVKRVRSVK